MTFLQFLNAHWRDIYAGSRDIEIGLMIIFGAAHILKALFAGFKSLDVQR